MRIKSKIQPLVFCFSTIDRLLEAMANAENENISLSFYKGRYYLTVYCKFRKRFFIIEKLSEIGSYNGLGTVLDAFYAEHGTQICKEIKVGCYTKAN